MANTEIDLERIRSALSKNSPESLSEAEQAIYKLVIFSIQDPEEFNLENWSSPHFFQITSIVASLDRRTARIIRNKKT